MKNAVADAARCLSLLALAQARPMATPKELARLAHVPLRQAYKDLFGTLLLCGVPPYLPHQFVTCVLENGRVRTAFAEHLTTPVALTEIETAALVAAADSLFGGARTAEIDALLAKAEASLPERSKKRWRRLRKALVLKSSDAATPTLRVFEDAARRRKFTAFDYLPLGKSERTSRVVAPYGVFRRDGAWYLAARDRDDGKIRTFRLDRMKDARVLDETFDAPSDFSLERLAATPAASDGRPSTIRLGVEAERVVSGLGYETRAARGKDARATWRPRFSDADAFAAFLVGLGTSDFEVTEPADLRERVRRLAAASAAAHGAAAEP